jgi:D-3-phosphoglycerate dehydrogenase
MSTILFADYDYHDISLERGILDRHGIRLDLAQCKTEDDVIAAAKDARGILLQYAPITERVVAALRASAS